VSVLAVFESAGIATAQDGGRRGFEHVGVPVAGAWHRGRYEMASALLLGRVDDRCPVIEAVAGAVSLRATSDLVLVAVGPAELTLDGKVAAMGAVIHAQAGQRLRLRHVGPGPVYLAVSGWRPDDILGSCSVDTFSRLGGRAFRAGDELRGTTTAGSEDRVGWFHRPDPTTSGALRVIGFGSHVQEFCSSRWRVDSAARSGVRLRARRWAGPRQSIATMPVVPGAIQLTPDGEAIILGPDGALTGGYPVVGVVSTIDLDRVSLLEPGADVAFTDVTVESAVEADLAARTARSRLLVHPGTLA
jgi:5-oxoprolinase (ATP-hydrolysing) subunit C